MNKERREVELLQRALKCIGESSNKELCGEIEVFLAQPEQKQEIPYGVGRLLEFAGKNIRSTIKSERAPPHLYLTRKDCIEVGNYLKELGL